jgi:uncharacterized protein with HEPN domain
MREDGIYLQDIIESIERIVEYLGDKTEAELETDFLVQDAIFRRFEIIGEAAANLSDGFKNQYPAVEWRLMKAMRNKLIHEYFGISTTTVYETIKRDLPALLIKLKAIA